VQKGFYVDVGANDPVIDSVTKLLYDEGWSGVNIEPIKRHFVDLQRLRPRDTNLQIGLSDASGRLKFTEYPDGDGLSTFDVSMQTLYKKGEHSFPTKKTKSYEVPVETLKHVMEEVDPPHIHFLKIDVEGYEYNVIKGYDWRVLPELICIEANHIGEDWRPLLSKRGYSLVFFDGINNYYLAKGSLKRKDYFDYASAAFAGNPVYYPTYCEIQHQEEEAKVAPLKEALADRETQIANLERQQRNVRFLAKRLFLEVQLRINKRANTMPSVTRLVYSDDPRLRGVLNQAKWSKQVLIKLVHECDQENIIQRRVAGRSVGAVAFWKLSAKALGLTIRVARKAIRA
jgi:FkbM family methyltransferase